MNKILSNAANANKVARTLGYINFGLTSYDYAQGEMSSYTYAIEMGSNSISTFAPPLISLPWTVGYEGLGRNGIARIPWYQNTFKPYVRNKIGLND